MEFSIFPVMVNEIDICPEGARRSLDGTKWICHDPQYAPKGIAPFKTLGYDEAKALTDTPEWKTEGDA